MPEIRRTPKADAVYALLKRRILEGGYPEGVLPIEPDLAVQLKVARKTLRSALARLALENYIVRIKGEGTFIRRAEERMGKILVLLRDGEDITNPDRYILPGIQQEAAAMNLAVETCTMLSLTAGPPDAAVRRIQRRMYSGILSMTSNFRGDEPIIGILKETGLPVVLPHAQPSDSEKTGFAVMGTDYPQVVRDGLHYLASLGHRRIAYLAHREFRIGRENYFQILEELGLPRDEKLYVNSPSHNDRDTILAAVERLFTGLRKRPTAVFCFSDFFAICLYEYLRRHRIRIPEDIAVLSIGGMIGCDFLTPPLSAMDFGCAEIGRTAVRVLMEMKMKHETTRPFMIMPHHLTERESTRKPDGTKGSGI